MATVVASARRKASSAARWRTQDLEVAAWASSRVLAADSRSFSRDLRVVSRVAMRVRREEEMSSCLREDSSLLWACRMWWASGQGSVGIYGRVLVEIRTMALCLDRSWLLL